MKRERVASRARRWWHEVRKHVTVRTVIPDKNPDFNVRGILCVTCRASWRR